MLAPASRVGSDLSPAKPAHACAMRCRHIGPTSRTEDDHRLIHYAVGPPPPQNCSITRRAPCLTRFGNMRERQCGPQTATVHPQLGNIPAGYRMSIPILAGGENPGGRRLPGGGIDATSPPFPVTALRVAVIPAPPRPAAGIAEKPSGPEPPDEPGVLRAERIPQSASSSSSPRRARPDEHAGDFISAAAWWGIRLAVGSLRVRDNVRLPIPVLVIVLLSWPAGRASGKDRWSSIVLPPPRAWPGRHAGPPGRDPTPPPGAKLLVECPGQALAGYGSALTGRSFLLSQATPGALPGLAGHTRSADLAAESCTGRPGRFGRRGRYVGPGGQASGSGGQQPGVRVGDAWWETPGRAARRRGTRFATSRRTCVIAKLVALSADTRPAAEPRRPCGPLPAIARRKSRDRRCALWTRARSAWSSGSPPHRTRTHRWTPRRVRQSRPAHWPWSGRAADARFWYVRLVQEAAPDPPRTLVTSLPAGRAAPTSLPAGGPEQAPATRPVAIGPGTGGAGVARPAHGRALG